MWSVRLGQYLVEERLGLVVFGARQPSEQRKRRRLDVKDQYREPWNRNLRDSDRALALTLAGIASAALASVETSNPVS
ncbi:hypothetical protein [Streptomyces sp. NPDC089915]|uniref:hypothetical protein n=1 Tax=Streptomyces sp. NPDC089915 TaxID=3155186 RepID=UPI00343E0CD9